MNLACSNQRRGLWRDAGCRCRCCSRDHRRFGNQSAGRYPRHRPSSSKEENDQGTAKQSHSSGTETESDRATGVAIHGYAVCCSLRVGGWECKYKSTRTMKVKSGHHKVSGAHPPKLIG